MTGERELEFSFDLPAERNKKIYVRTRHLEGKEDVYNRNIGARPNKSSKKDVG